MDLSLNEVEATVVKAARGRGLDHGIATEVGAAARWLCERSNDGVRAAVEALSALDEDGNDSFGITAVEVAVATGSIVQMELPASLLLLQGLAGRIGAQLKVVDSGCEIIPTPPDVHQSPVSSAVLHHGHDWEQIERWAALTYVPSTDQSRVAGAGAGLTDND